MTELKPASALLILLIFFTFACRQKMAQQPRLNLYAPSDFFSDQSSARPLVSGVVPQSAMNLDPKILTGTDQGKPLEDFPLELTEVLLKRGQERFNIYCSACHGRLGNGQGMVVKRGFPAPQSFHINRLKEAPVGYFFNVITQGFGRMYAYDDRVSVKDRWAIIAYIRALQLSQGLSYNELPADEKQRLSSP